MAMPQVTMELKLHVRLLPSLNSNGVKLSYKNNINALTVRYFQEDCNVSAIGLPCIE